MKNNNKSQNIFLLAAAIAIFSIFAIIYNFVGFRAYYNALSIWGIRPWYVKAGGSLAFMDGQVVLAAAQCARLGYDVFVINPCEMTGKIFNYSPLWLAISPVSTSPAWRVPLGIGLFGGFALALLLLPRARGWRDTVLLAAGVGSSATAMAVERGNLELVLFVMAVGAASLASRSARPRMAAYGLALTAGLLKYYPLALMLLATREKWRTFLVVALVSLAVVGGYVALAWHDLVRAISFVPVDFGEFKSGFTFGAQRAGLAIAEQMRLPDGSGGLIRWLMSAGALALGIGLGRRSDTGEAIARLSEQQKTFLLVGALMILPSFFAAENYYHRAIYLLLVAPVALAMRSHAQLWHLRYLGPVAIILMWFPAVMFPLAPKVIVYGRWVAMEALWWGLIVMLLACVTALLLQSRLVRQLLHRP